MKTALTIDIDYFDTLPKNKNKEKEIDKIFSKVLELNNQWHLYQDHHHVLKDINNLDCDYLVNLDTHDDLMANIDITPNEGLGCGNWVAWVNWRRDGTYHWIKPSAICMSRDVGRCDNVNVWEDPQTSDWEKLKHSTGPKEFFNLDSVEYVGIVASPNYSNRTTIRYFTENYIKKEVAEIKWHSYAKKGFIKMESKNW